MDNKPPLKGAGSGSNDPFLVLMPAIISLEWLKLVSPNFVCRWNMSSASLRMTDYPLIGVVRVTWPIKNFFNHIFGIDKARHYKFLVCWLMHRSTSARNTSTSTSASPKGMHSE